MGFNQIQLFWPQPQTRWRWATNRRLVLLKKSIQDHLQTFFSCFAEALLFEVNPSFGCSEPQRWSPSPCPAFALPFALSIPIRYDPYRSLGFHTNSSAKLASNNPGPGAEMCKDAEMLRRTRHAATLPRYSSALIFRTQHTQFEWSVFDGNVLLNT